GGEIGGGAWSSARSAVAGRAARNLPRERGAAAVGKARQLGALAPDRHVYAGGAPHTAAGSRTPACRRHPRLRAAGGGLRRLRAAGGEELFLATLLPRPLHARLLP